MIPGIRNQLCKFQLFLNMLKEKERKTHIKQTKFSHRTHSWIQGGGRNVPPPHNSRCNVLFLCTFRQKSSQECIPVGFVPSAAVAVSPGDRLLRGVCSRGCRLAGCLLLRGESAPRWSAPGDVCFGGCLHQGGGCLLWGVTALEEGFLLLVRGPESSFGRHIR